MTTNDNEEVKVLKTIEKKLEEIECKLSRCKDTGVSWYNAYQGKVKK